ncbi:hypothetical protein T310_4098 [Rasamsonia emersonii CBS 393.64]|uniref:Uncharacterized protein n=1 Tax=Rasamsonia emersonii (strain ATCC 16479 / CBS 393.64 / IMI 116815) TaxID=1408163 RepID=A0A0F4YUM2_RASE3|nr:hypothetical protein T310_4098 [Rasamsonia emersonii CBS 393.64]KKA21934.1 hypothetical protein T310_4098 [Rasamsonia emersonii CBS 393.64]
MARVPAAEEMEHSDWHGRFEYTPCSVVSLVIQQKAEKKSIAFAVLLVSKEVDGAVWRSVTHHGGSLSKSIKLSVLFLFARWLLGELSSRQLKSHLDSLLQQPGIEQHFDVHIKRKVYS